MNKYKVFLLSVLVFEAILLFAPLPIIANIFGFAPVLIYSLIYTLLVKETDNYLKSLGKSFVAFLMPASMCFVDPFLIVGVVICSINILVAIFLIPAITIRYGKKE